VKALRKDFGITNQQALPKIEKVVVNVGVGKIHKEQQIIDMIAEDLAVITGQKAATILSKRAIAGFKIRQGAPSGLKVTLRGLRMWEFLDRLVHIALPRTRDFQGIPKTSIDKEGNLNIGIREHTIFPEIRPEKVKRIFSLQINVVTSTRDIDQARVLFSALKFPIRKD